MWATTNLAQLQAENCMWNSVWNFAKVTTVPTKNSNRSKGVGSTAKRLFGEAVTKTQKEHIFVGTDGISSVDACSSMAWAMVKITTVG